jgi:Domain of unknown function (DUF4389)
MEPHPFQVVVADDLHRSRLTVFFRLLLAIPHLFWYFIWSIGAFFAAIINWFATLIKGTSPKSLHDFFASYVRYTTHLYAYICLAANPWPGFLGTPGSYPVDVEIAPPQAQNRWKTLARIFLAIPALLLASVLVGVPGLGGGGGGGRREGDEWWAQASGGGLIFAIAFLAWFVCLIRGRMPNGFRDLQAYALRYNAQALGYVLLVTDRYPNSDPSFPSAAPPPDRPAVQIRVEDDLRRSRVTVFFRFLLFLPHLVWLLLWSITVFFVVIASWVVALVIGRVPAGFHRFDSAFLRYYAHVVAYLFLVANPFPGFTGAPGVYPVDLEIDPPQPQRRWKTLLRLFLAIPAFIVSSGLGSALVLVGIFGWFVGLVRGRMPEGLRNLGAFAIRYAAQAYAYLYLLTDRYPYSGPWEWAPPAEAAPEPAPGPEAAAA